VQALERAGFIWISGHRFACARGLFAFERDQERRSSSAGSGVHKSDLRAICHFESPLCWRPTEGGWSGRFQDNTKFRRENFIRVASGSILLPKTRYNLPVCGRFAAQLPPEFIRVSPTQSVMVVRRHPESGERRLDVLRWGLVPHFTKDIQTTEIRPINARSETAATTLPTGRARWWRPEAMHGRTWIWPHGPGHFGALVSIADASSRDVRCYREGLATLRPL
jgi:hypothetical protein